MKPYATSEALNRLQAMTTTNPDASLDWLTIRAAIAEGDRLDALVNSPEIEDFLRGVKLEAVHQVEKWGDAHDRGKSAENWFWLVGYLAGKCLRSVIVGKRDKALHHTISTAAACLNWHSAIRRDTTGSGIGQDDDIRPIEISRFEQSDREHVHYLGGSGHGGTIVV